MFKLENNIPIPAEPSNRKKAGYPILQMKKGQSFEADKEHIHNIRVLIAQTKKRYPGCNYTTRKTGEATYRIWRTA